MQEKLKNRVSHDIRFPKTNYLKTNLLKQIKKISFTQLFLILSCSEEYLPLHAAKVRRKTRIPKYFPEKFDVCAQKP